MDEEGWQPLISLGWSDKEEYQKAAAASFANLRMRGLQAAACIREGGLRCLLHLLQVRFYIPSLDACCDALLSCSVAPTRTSSCWRVLRSPACAVTRWSSSP